MADLNLQYSTHAIILTLRRISGGQDRRTRAELTFLPKSIKEPIFSKLGQRFAVVTDISRGDINGDKGWTVLELEGKGEDIDRGIAGRLTEW
jgi:hypothetical protein